jgi:OOP family OmpA-OmpF porin
MGNNILLILFLFISNAIFAQEQQDSIPKNLTNTKWRVEIGFGSSQGMRPYKKGYYATENGKVFGELHINSYKVGATYNFSRTLGLRTDLAFDRFKNSDSKSLSFETVQYRTSFQIMVNLSNYLNPENEINRFNLTFHGGLNLGSLITVKTKENQKIGSPDLIGGVVFGIMPMFRISKRSHIFVDLSSFVNYRQNHNWDGSVSEVSNNLSGQMINGTFGITYSVGKTIQRVSKNKVETIKIDGLEKRLGDLEIMMNDVDTDGVPDYLDVENNSTAGITVDTKGRMIDVNKNGVPDELERKNTIAATQPSGNESNNQAITIKEASNSTESINQLINDGYVTVYFDSNSTRPTPLASEGINFMLMYLRKNPTVKLNVVGHSDEVGNSKFNNKLAIARANSVKKTLVNAGIDALRLNTISAGEDQSVDPKSRDARSLVRRVTFELK